MEKAAHLSSTNPDYAIGDLFNAIANGNYPSWTFYIQVMTFEQAEKFQFNPFDLTKVTHNSETDFKSDFSHPSLRLHSSDSSQQRLITDYFYM